MNYGQIERKTFKSYLIFSSFALIFLLASIAFVFSSNYRISNIEYNTNLPLNYSSINKLIGTSIWLVDNDQVSDNFYFDNPTVANVLIDIEMPKTLVVDVKLSKELATINDARQYPPRTFVLYKNLHQGKATSNGSLMKVSIINGPVAEGFFEELATFVLTLNKYSINLSNVSLVHDGEEIVATHFNTSINLGSPIDLARKGTLVGFYLSEGSCNDGEITLVYTQDGKNLKGIKNC